MIRSDLRRTHLNKDGLPPRLGAFTIEEGIRNVAKVTPQSAAPKPTWLGSL